MDTLSVLARGMANREKELMVFDWEKAARLIKEKTEITLRHGWIVIGNGQEGSFLRVANL